MPYELKGLSLEALTFLGNVKRANTSLICRAIGSKDNPDSRKNSVLLRMVESDLIGRVRYNENDEYTYYLRLKGANYLTERVYMHSRVINPVAKPAQVKLYHDVQISLLKYLIQLSLPNVEWLNNNNIIAGIIPDIAFKHNDCYYFLEYCFQETTPQILKSIDSYKRATLPSDKCTLLYVLKYFSINTLDFIAKKTLLLPAILLASSDVIVEKDVRFLFEKIWYYNSSDGVFNIDSILND